MEETALSFEDALKKLEGIVRDLQSGDAPLEEGTALVKYCSSLLDNAEREIKKLVQSADGTVREEDFDQN